MPAVTYTKDYSTGKIRSQVILNIMYNIREFVINIDNLVRVTQAVQNDPSRRAIDGCFARTARKDAFE